MNDYFYFPVIINFIGIAVIYACWNHFNRNKFALNFVGWGVITISMLFWVEFYGAEYGIVFSCISISITGLLCLGVNYQRRPQKVVQKNYQNNWIGVRQTSTRFLTFLVAGPLALFACCALCLLIPHWFSEQRSHNLVLAAFLLPILWGLVSFWVCAKDELLVPFVVILLTGIFSSLILFL